MKESPTFMCDRCGKSGCLKVFDVRIQGYYHLNEWCQYCYNLILPLINTKESL